MAKKNLFYITPLSNGSISWYTDSTNNQYSSPAPFKSPYLNGLNLGGSMKLPKLGSTQGQMPSELVERVLNYQEPQIIKPEDVPDTRNFFAKTMDWLGFKKPETIPTGYQNMKNTIQNNTALTGNIFGFEKPDRSAPDYTPWKEAVATAEYIGGNLGVGVTNVLGGIWSLADKAFASQMAPTINEMYKILGNPNKELYPSLSGVYGTLIKYAGGIDTSKVRSKVLRDAINGLQEGKGVIREGLGKVSTALSDMTDPLAKQISQVGQLLGAVANSAPQSALMALPGGIALYSGVSLAQNVDKYVIGARPVEQEIAYAVFSTAIDAASEQIFGLFGEATSLFKGAAAKMAAKAAKKEIIPTVGRLIGSVLLSGAEEGAEEVIAFPLQALLDWRYFYPNMPLKEYVTWEKAKQWGQAGIVGFASGLIFASTKVAPVLFDKNRPAYVRMMKATQAVVEHEIDPNNPRKQDPVLAAKVETLANEVLQATKNGDISIDDILSGETTAPTPQQAAPAPLEQAGGVDTGSTLNHNTPRYNRGSAVIIDLPIDEAKKYAFLKPDTPDTVPVNYIKGTIDLQEYNASGDTKLATSRFDSIKQAPNTVRYVHWTDPQSAYDIETNGFNLKTYGDLSSSSDVLTDSHDQSAQIFAQMLAKKPATPAAAPTQQQEQPRIMRYKQSVAASTKTEGGKTSTKKANKAAPVNQEKLVDQKTYATTTKAGEMVSLATNPKIAKAPSGKTVRVTISANRPAEQALVRAVQLDDVLGSYDADGNIQAGYDWTFQPRGKKRGADLFMINDIAFKTNMAMLAGTESLQEGTPVILGNGMVLAGNNRVAGLLLMRRDNKPKYEAYKQFMRDNASYYGLSPADLTGDFIVVREGNESMATRDIAEATNEGTTRRMTAPERAVVDADRMTDELLSMLNPSASGDLDSDSNKDFVRGFLATVVPTTELNTMRTEDNLHLSAEGAIRIRNAIFQKAYGSMTLLDLISERSDDNLKSLKNSLVEISLKVLAIRNDIKRGALFNVDMAGDIARSAERYFRMRDGGRTNKQVLRDINMEIRQQGMADTTNDVIARDMVRAIAALKGNALEFYNQLLNMVTAAGDPRVQDMFSAAKPAPTRIEILNAALKGSYVDEKAAEESGNGETAEGVGSELPVARSTETAEPIKESEQKTVTLQDYRMAHKAPVREKGNTMDDLSIVFPEDVYGDNAVRFYGTGDTSMDTQAANAIKRVKGKPDATVMIYRAVPKGYKDINAGDWVTISRQYAVLHGEGVLGGEYDIIQKIATAKELATAGDWLEWSYNPVATPATQQSNQIEMVEPAKPAEPAPVKPKAKKSAKKEPVEVAIPEQSAPAKQETAQVTLSETNEQKAERLIARYRDIESKLPSIRKAKYNDSLDKIIAISNAEASLTNIITILNDMGASMPSDMREAYNARQEHKAKVNKRVKEEDARRKAQMAIDEATGRMNKEQQEATAKAVMPETVVEKPSDNPPALHKYIADLSDNIKQITTSKNGDKHNDFAGFKVVDSPNLKGDAGINIANKTIFIGQNFYHRNAATKTRIIVHEYVHALLANHYKLNNTTKHEFYEGDIYGRYDAETNKFKGLRGETDVEEAIGNFITDMLLDEGYQNRRSVNTIAYKKAYANAAVLMDTITREMGEQKVPEAEPVATTIDGRQLALDIMAGKETAIEDMQEWLETEDGRVLMSGVNDIQSLLDALNQAKEELLMYSRSRSTKIKASKMLESFGMKLVAYTTMLDKMSMAMEINKQYQKENKLGERNKLVDAKNFMLKFAAAVKRGQSAEVIKLIESEISFDDLIYAVTGVASVRNEAEMQLASMTDEELDRRAKGLWQDKLVYRPEDTFVFREYAKRLIATNLPENISKGMAIGKLVANKLHAIGLTLRMAAIVGDETERLARSLSSEVESMRDALQDKDVEDGADYMFTIAAEVRLGAVNGALSVALKNLYAASEGLNAEEKKELMNTERSMSEILADRIANHARTKNRIPKIKSPEQRMIDWAFSHYLEKNPASIDKMENYLKLALKFEYQKRIDRELAIEEKRKKEDRLSRDDIIKKVYREVKGREIFKVMGEMMLKRGEYKELWDEAQTMVAEWTELALAEYENLNEEELRQAFDIPSTVKDLQTYLKTVVADQIKKDLSGYIKILGDPATADRYLARLVVANIKSMDMSINEMAKDFFKRGDESISDFLAKLAENMPVLQNNPEAVEYLNTYVRDRFIEQMNKQKLDMQRRFLVRYERDKAKKPPASAQDAIIEKMTNAAYYDEMSIDDYNEAWAARIGVPYLTKEMQQRISDDMKRYHQAKTPDERNKIYDDLAGWLANQIPATGLEKFIAWRRFSMLLSPVSWLKNAFSNMATFPMYMLTDKTVNMWQRFRGTPMELRIAGNTGVSVKGDSDIAKVVRSVETDAELYRLMIDTAKYSFARWIQAHKNIFKSEKMNKMMNIPFNAMSTGKIGFEKIEAALRLEKWLGDTPWFKMHFQQAMANKMNALGYKESMTENQKTEIIDKSIRWASEVATTRTFRQMNKLSEMFKRIRSQAQDNARIAELVKAGDIAKARAVKRNQKIVIGILDVFQPFVITPAALLVEAYKFSPLAGVSAAVQFVANKARGTLDDGNVRVDIQQKMSQALVGTVGTFITGYLLAALGLIDGAPPDSDKEKEMWKLQGRKPYSLRIPGIGSVSIDWMQPVSTGLLMGANAFHSAKDGVGFGDKVGKFTASMIDTLFMNSVVDNLRTQFGSGNVSGAMVDLGLSAISQSLPGIIRRFNRVIDPYEREVYSPDALQSFFNNFVTHIPGVGNFALNKQVDMWGNDIMQIPEEKPSAFGMAGRFFLNLVSPFTVKPEKMDATSKEVLRVYEATKDKGSEALPPMVTRTISRTKNGEKQVWTLTPEQYYQYQKRVGQLCYEAAQKVASRQGDDYDKAGWLSRAYEDAVAKAKAEFIKANPLP